MLKQTLLAVLLCSAALTHAACESSYTGQKPVFAKKTVLLCRLNYEILYSPEHKAPIYAAEHLDPASKDIVLRQNDFKPDYELPKGTRAEMADFLNSGYDKGHLASAENHSQTAEIMSQSFLLSNIVAQVPSHNRLIWRLLEASIIKRVRTQGEEAYVLTGPTFIGAKLKTIGANKVAVPTALWKVVVWPQSKQAQAWLIPNVQVAPKDKFASFAISLPELQAKTGLTLFPNTTYPWLAVK